MLNDKEKKRIGRILELKKEGLSTKDAFKQLRDEGLGFDKRPERPERNIHFIFQIMGKNNTTEELEELLGKTSDCKPRPNNKKFGWHFTLQRKVKFGHSEQFINEILDEFESKKDIIKQLKENGEDIVILDLSEPRDFPHIFGLSAEIMARLGAFGIALNISPAHYLQG